MKLTSLFSGGKDSTMALYKALRQGHEVPVLLSMLPERDDSYMYHVPNINLTKYSAEAVGIPLVAKVTSGEPPQENLDLECALIELKNNFKIRGVSVGAVHSNYQYKIVSEICSKLNLNVFAPYWQHDHCELIEEALDAGFEISVFGVAAEGRDESWLGRKVDRDALIELKKKSKIYLLML